jgi:hypothetical protein
VFFRARVPERLRFVARGRADGWIRWRRLRSVIHPSIHRWRSPSTPEVDYDRLTPIVEAEVSRCVHLHPLLQAPDRPSAGLGPVPVGSVLQSTCSVPQRTAAYRSVPQRTAEYH